MSLRLRALVPAALALSSIAAIRNYDFFWHLATGRWIVEHRALPAVDPFAVASDRVPWINGEWLFEVVAYALHSMIGGAGLSLLRGVMIALLFTLAWRFAARESDETAALLLTCVAFAGAMPTLDVRPSSVAALFVTLAIITARHGSVVLYAVLTVLWINVHPSALLAPFFGAVVRRKVALPVVSALALLVNPHGWNAIVAPVKLVLFVGGGEFVNTEWLPSSPVQFPLLYIALAIAFAAFATAEDRREHWWRIVLVVALGWLAVRHIRHQSLFFAAYPLLVAPAVRRGVVTKRVAYAASALVILFVAATVDHRLGPQPTRFPIASIARLQQLGLRGNVYNPDQFGGYLIWSFYPERRALTDGRNELHHTFIREYAVARRDQRAWRALLRKYRIDVAVDEYQPPLPVMDFATKQQRMMPASLAFWPRNEWALIAYDEVSMVFARRAAFRGIEKVEIRGVVPDAR